MKDTTVAMQNSDPSVTIAQLRFLDRIAGKGTDFVPPGYFEYEYHMNCQATIKELFRRGLLTYSGPAESVEMADMPTLRELAKNKGLKAGGKKVDLVKRILGNYTAEELSKCNLPKRYALTDKGKAVLKKNDALIRYYLAFSSHEWTTSEEIIAAQNTHPELSGEEILVMMLNERIKKARSYSAKLPLYHCMMHFCHDDDSRQTLTRTIEAVAAAADRELKRHQAKALKQSAAAFGMTAEELQALHEKARHELAEKTSTDAGYDFSTNPHIMDRVKALDDESRDAFYQTMEKRQATRRDDDVLSLSDYASLTLDALERSARMRNGGG